MKNKQSDFTILLLAILLLFTGSFMKLSAQESSNLKGKKIALIVANNGYRDEEFEEPRDYFNNHGAEVVVVSSSLKTAQGSMGGEVKPDKLLNNISAGEFDAIVFVGGPGANEYFKSEKALALVKDAHKEKKIIAAICIAPNILNNAGILKGKKATAWSFNDKKTGVIIVNQNVVTDGKIITANGPRAALQFAEAIGKALSN